MENGVNEHPLLVEAMEIVKNVPFVIFVIVLLSYGVICGQVILLIVICSCKCIGGIRRLISLLRTCHKGFWFLMSPRLPISFHPGISRSRITLNFEFL